MPRGQENGPRGRVEVVPFFFNLALSFTSLVLFYFLITYLIIILIKNF